MKNKTTNNISCRIFKEQIDLVNQLPEQDRATVLYLAVMGSFNQFENQFENQNENAYISVSVSISDLSKSVLNLLSKNIVTKEFSKNYGGKRTGSGRPKNPQANLNETPIKPQNNPKITPDENENNEDDFVLIEEGSFYLDDTMPDYKEHLKGMSDYAVEKLWKWIFDNKYGERVSKQWIIERIKQFNNTKEVK